MIFKKSRYFHFVPPYGHGNKEHGASASQKLIIGNNPCLSHLRLEFTDCTCEHDHSFWNSIKKRTEVWGMSDPKIADPKIEEKDWNFYFHIWKWFQTKLLSYWKQDWRSFSPSCQIRLLIYYALDWKIIRNPEKPKETLRNLNKPLKLKKL